MNTPIVFAMDDNYAMPTSIAIGSILKNISISDVDIYILYKDSLNESSRTFIECAVNRYRRTNCQIEYLDIGERLGELKSTIQHISAATFYRILLPELLQKHKQCLYLDGDIVVAGDIGDLVMMELPRHVYIAAVKTVMLQTARKKIQEKRRDQLGINEIDSYFNAGVTLMNLEQLRINNCVQKMISLIPLSFPLQDQDILNKVCYGHLLNLPPKYNAMPITLSNYSSRASKVYSKEDLDEAREKPVIINHADWRKPWQYSNISKVEVWDQIYDEMYGIEHLERNRVTCLDNTKDLFKRVKQLLLK